MRINKYIAQSTGLSRRAADEAIAQGRVSVNGSQPEPGQDINDTDQVTLDSQLLKPTEDTVTIMLNKPVGYVCSRDGQGSQTIYNLLPAEYHNLKPVGRLDKDSSGLLLLTNDGQLAQKLTHPSFQKTKVYQVRLGRDLTSAHLQAIKNGVELDDGPSRLQIQGAGRDWTITMSEGRNRQIRRTFAALGYMLSGLHRTQFGPYQLGGLAEGKYLLIK